MKEEDIIALLEKYDKGECTDEERIFIENWYNDQAKKNAGTLNEEVLFLTHEAGLEMILQRNLNFITWPLRLLLIAATVAIVGSIWTVLFTRPNYQQASYSNDVDPGGNKALLTLQNGKSIPLSDAQSGVVIDASKLSYNDGTLINNESAETFTVSTPIGGTYQVRLPDGSTVWLNAASSITYNAPGNNNQAYRNVSLKGEAYFEVSKDKDHPFIVSTQQQSVEVLGTHFNISAYSDDQSVKTSLLEGSVRVSPIAVRGSATKDILLKPNQQSVLNSNGIYVAKADMNEAIAWKNGEFAFANENLENIMQKVARWYDVEVIYTDKKLAVKPFSGTISKYKKVSQILCLLEATKEVSFKIEGRRITVMP